MSLIELSPDLSVLNCGAGDMTFSFDPKDPQECARAERVVQDMLSRGYLLFAHVGKRMVRVKKFDAKRREYIIAAGPETVLPKSAKPKATTQRIKAHKTRTTAIAPTAGG